MLRISLFTRAALRHILLGALGASAAIACPAAMALTISGSPPGAVVAGHAYSFTPTTTDSPGRTLKFSITTKPSWATFSTSNGRLSGTPAVALGGTKSANFVISVSDGTSTAALPASFIVVHVADKLPPVISGTPASSVSVGGTYTFQPAAKDPAGNSMYFSVYNKPAWASFSVATGALSGKPTSAQVGTYAGITIRASDGQLAASTPAFSITVKSSTAPPPPAAGTAKVMWTPPTENTNGTALTNLAGYRLHYGTSASNLSAVVQLASASMTSYTLNNLAAATWYFAITAYTTTGLESGMSRTVSKTVP